MKSGKKKRFKKRYWLLIDLAVVLVILILLLYRPARYEPVDVVPAGREDGQVSPYLTHELLPQLYNGLQCREPFDLIVTQKGINDIITWSQWPKNTGNVGFSAPEVLFVPGGIVLMGTVDVKGVGFVVTVVIAPALDEKGLLNLRVDKVRVGAINITILARAIARRMYLKQLDTKDIDPEDLGVQIAASLLNNEPFEPVFEIDDERVRLEKITIENEKLTIRLAPAFN